MLLIFFKLFPQFFQNSLTIFIKFIKKFLRFHFISSKLITNFTEISFKKLLKNSNTNLKIYFMLLQDFFDCSWCFIIFLNILGNLTNFPSHFTVFVKKFGGCSRISAWFSRFHQHFSKIVLKSFKSLHKVFSKFSWKFLIISTKSIQYFLTIFFKILPHNSYNIVVNIFTEISISSKLFSICTYHIWTVRSPL